MAFVDNRGSRNRPAVTIATIGIEALAILAVVKGLDVPFLTKEPEQRPEVRNIPLDPPPPVPTPKVPNKPSIAHDRHVDIPLKPTGDVLIPPTDPLPLPGPITDPLPLANSDPLPAPKPQIAKSARPAGNPRTWVSTDDYPARDLRNGIQGTTGFELTVNEAGRAVSCRVTKSSGSASLDQAACAALLRRAKFTPATDTSGAITQGSYAGSIHWVLPE